MEEELFDDVGNGTAHETEVDAGRRLEANGLERRRNESADRREMGSEHHVLTALEDVQLRLERAGGSAQVGGRDDVEDDLARGRDANGERTERPDGSPDADIDGDHAARE